MAYVNIMYNPEHHQSSSSSFMAPRMSFSSDFAVEPPPPPAAGGGAAPGDADFEFSLGGHHPAAAGHSMIAADQLFSKGRLLPLREAPHGGGRPLTLRDELRADDRHGRAPRAPSIRWKELLGLRKAPKKPPAAVDAAAGTSADAHMDLGGQGGTRD